MPSVIRNREQMEVIFISRIAARVLASMILSWLFQNKKKVHPRFHYSTLFSFHFLFWTLFSFLFLFLSKSLFFFSSISMRKIKIEFGEKFNFYF